VSDDDEMSVRERKSVCVRVCERDHEIPGPGLVLSFSKGPVYIYTTMMMI
jgi:hypothetical protein